MFSQPGRTVRHGNGLPLGEEREGPVQVAQAAQPLSKASRVAQGIATEPPTPTLYGLLVLWRFPPPHYGNTGYLK